MKVDVDKLLSGRRAALIVGLMLVVVASATASASATTSRALSPRKHVTIAFFDAAPVLQPFVVGGWGALDAGQVAGNATVIDKGPSNPTPSLSYAFALNLAVANHPDGYVMADDYPALDGLFPKLLQNSNNNVIVWQNAPTNTASQKIPKGGTTFVGPNFANLGYLSAKVAIQASKLSKKTTGTAIVGECVSTPNNDREEHAADNEIKALLPNVTVQNFGTDLSQAADQADWTSEIGKTAHLVLAFPVCSDDTQSLLVIKDRHIGGSFVAAAVSPSSSQQFAAIADGEFSGGAAMNFWLSGYVATRLAINAARGVPFPKGFINSGLTSVTKANAATVAAAYKSPASAAKAYQAMGNAMVKDVKADVQPMANEFKVTL